VAISCFLDRPYPSHVERAFRDLEALHGFATAKLPVPDIEQKSAKTNVALIHRTILQKWQQLQDPKNLTQNT